MMDIPPKDKNEDLPPVTMNADGEIIETGPDTRKRKRKSYRARRLRRTLIVLLEVILLPIIGFGSALLVVQRASPSAITSVSVPAPVVVAQSDTSNGVTDAQSLLLANGAEQALQQNDPDLALGLAIAAADRPQLPVSVWRTLIQAAYAPGIHRLFIDEFGITNIAVSRDGKWLAAADWGSKQITLWNTATGQRLPKFGLETPRNDNRLDVVAFSPDAHSVAFAGGGDLTIYLFDTQTGKEIRRFEGHEAPVHALAFSSDGQYLLSGGSDITTNDAQGKPKQFVDHTVRLWDVKTGQEIHRFEGHTSSIATVAFGPNDATCFSVSDDGSIFEWQIESGLLLNQYYSKGLVNTVGNVSQNGSYGVVGGMPADLSGGGPLYLWNLEANTSSLLKKHTEQVSTISFSPDGQYFASGGYDDRLFLWKTVNGAEVRSFAGNAGWVMSTAFSPDGRYLFAAASPQRDDLRGFIRMWSIYPDAEITEQHYTTGIRSLALSEDNKILLLGMDNGDLVAQDMATNQQIWRVPTGMGAIVTLALSPDAKLVAVGTSAPKAQLTVWDTQSRKQQKVFQSSNTVDDFKRVKFTSDGTKLLAVTTAGKTPIWDVNTGNLIGELAQAGDEVEDIALSSDGRLALVGVQHGTAVLWNISTQQVIETLTGPITANLSAVALSPDGQLALAGLSDGNIIEWDIKSGKQIGKFTGQNGIISRLVFTPNGQNLLSSATTDTDNVVLWDVSSRQQLYNYPGDTDAVNDLAISSDGLTAISVSADRSLRIWDLPGNKDNLLSWIKQNRYVRDLTCAEHNQYSIQPPCQQ